MLFAIHDESGRINQANKVYEPEGYDKLLDDLGHKYVSAQSTGLLPPEHWFVDVSAKELIERPIMNVQVSKTQIKAGDKDSALLTGIPKQSKVFIYAAGTELYKMDPFDAEELELSIPVPCTYTVVIDLWPYKTFRTVIEAVR
jgi:hypothetical protein